MAALLLGVVALALAWTTFRLERFGARQREVYGARALLMAVNQALVSDEEGLHRGWGQIYFTTVYTPGDSLIEVGQRAKRQAEMGAFDQVFVVPTEPLEKLATTDAAGDLISEETVAAANFGLWRVHVFNQLVLQQTVFNALTHSELVNAETTEARKNAIAESATRISQMLPPLRRRWRWDAGRLVRASPGRDYGRHQPSGNHGSKDVPSLAAGHSVCCHRRRHGDRSRRDCSRGWFRSVGAATRRVPSRTLRPVAATVEPPLEQLVRDELRGPVTELVRQVVVELVHEQLNGAAPSPGLTTETAVSGPENAQETRLRPGPKPKPRASRR